MMSHNNGHVTHTMMLTKTSSYVTSTDADRHENMYSLLYENRESFNRIYIPAFTWSRYQNKIKLEMEFIWGQQMNMTTTFGYHKIIYEDIVLNNERFGFKDLSKHNFIIREDESLAFVDLESYGNWTINQRRSHFLKEICNFPEEYLPSQVRSF